VHGGNKNESKGGKWGDFFRIWQKIQKINFLHKKFLLIFKEIWNFWQKKFANFVFSYIFLCSKQDERHLSTKRRICTRGKRIFYFSRKTLFELKNWSFLSFWN
jgi:hypothetical protein